MEEARKVRPTIRPGVGRPADPFRDDPPTESPEEAQDDRSLDERARDRWFLETRGGKRVPKKLNLINEALVTSRGPLVLQGNILLTDEEGRESWHNELHLCRCGATGKRPLCDGSHVELEFIDNGNVLDVSRTMPSLRPQTLKVTCLPNGPLRYKGFLRVYNKRGQECLSRSGDLCRCGMSSRKPFCDCV